jgi:hypothetical protein
MSGEIKITVSGTLANGSGASALKRSYGPLTATINQATKARAGTSQLLADSWELLDLGDLASSECYVYLSNLDATYNVEYGPLEEGSGGDGVLLGVIEPGDPPAIIHKQAAVSIMVRSAGGSGATARVDSEAWSV